MADSFADLWNSTAPAKTPNPAQKLGSPSIPQAQRRPQQDAFSLLSSSAVNSTPNSRPLTPAHQQKLSPKPPAPSSSSKPSPGGFDAFSDLLGGSSLSGAGSGANMTIAERAAKVERERLERLRGQQSVKQQQATSSAWAGLDSLAVSSSTTKPPKSGSVSTVDDGWGFGTPTTAPQKEPTTRTMRSTPSPAVIQDDDDWGLGDFGSAKPPVSAPKPKQSSSSQSTGLIWDLDEFGSEPASASAPPPASKTPQPSDSPGDFDFGDREDGLLDKDSGDEDDILGVLAKPVHAIPKRASPAIRTESPASVKPTSRGVSPPPHILGQIVEMGFSIQQAKVALASTDTGLDVQAAIETLIANGAGSTSTPPPEHPDRPPIRPRSSRPSQGPPTRTRSNVTKSGSPVSQTQEGGDTNLQEQAGRIIAQASEIGLGIFSRANALWREGKEKAQKVYEERAGSAPTNASTTTGNGKPRWMQEASRSHNDMDDDGGSGWKDSPGGGFSDEVSPSHSGGKKTRDQAHSAPAPKQPEPEPVDLFSEERPVYVSPYRRGKPKPPQSQSPHPPSASTSTPIATATPPRTQRASPIPAPTPRQNLVSASQSALSRSAKHKLVGGEKFKLGQYADAEAAYTSAIACLPDGHLLLIPLHNNRALTRLKTGDYAGAVEDASQVVEVVGGVGYNPAREQKVEKVEEGAGVDIGDGLAKALKRRAEAWEGREKWAEAGKDWEILAGMGWAAAGIRGEAVRGAGRCRRMLMAGEGGDGEVVTKPKPKPKPRPAPPVRKSTGGVNRNGGGAVAPSQALSNLRNATNAAEAEDQARHDLKDVVEQKLTAWKGGKESNIRALIASLDAVLWPELGLQKVGMADLVTPAQVKVRYTRVIAKLHPDKLHTNNTTVEQRMLANGVFGALNEAWNAFKQ